VRRNKKIMNPNLQRIRVEHEREFNAALDCLGIIEKVMDISMPIDEAGFLAMFLSIEFENKSVETASSGVMVIAHGSSTATSMAEVANRLLGVDHALGVNMPLDESPEQVLQRIREQIKGNPGRPGYIFLVDMGSLTTFGEIIEREMGLPVKVVPLVRYLTDFL
jgi:transcriptional regulatory protein LevR